MTSVDDNGSSGEAAANVSRVPTYDLLQNAEAYADSFVTGNRPASPASGVAVVTCMDARINVFGLFGLSEGDAHVLRNAGGIVTDDLIRSLTLSQRLLGTTEIMVVHHTDCGMLTFTDADMARQIESETGVRPPFEFGAFSNLAGDVRSSIARINASPFIPHKQVRGFIYDVGTGLLQEVV
jgi:carbonic anhydrase